LVARYLTLSQKNTLLLDHQIKACFPNFNPSCAAYLLEMSGKLKVGCVKLVCLGVELFGSKYENDSGCHKYVPIDLFLFIYSA
jgi:hypothetical protein